MQYNVTYNDTVHKYTVNVPKAKLSALRAKARGCGIYCLSVYVNAMIDRELTTDTGFAIQEIRNQSMRIASAEKCSERRYKDTLKEGFIKLSIRRISNIINPRQHIFDFKK